MSATAYTEYLRGLTERFCEEVANSAAHREAINSFGLVTDQFGLTPSICVSDNGSVSLTAIVFGDVASTVQALKEAGYTVGDLVESPLSFKGKSDWKAKVCGHGLDFKLHVTKKDQ